MMRQSARHAHTVIRTIVCAADTRTRTRTRTRTHTHTRTRTRTWRACDGAHASFDAGVASGVAADAHARVGVGAEWGDKRIKCGLNVTNTHRSSLALTHSAHDRQ